MNKNTLKLTTGAMFVAIFAMLLVINQQTGMIFEELIMYLLPIPMVAFAAKYGWKSGLPVMIAMILISVLFGTVTTIFYAATESLIGLVLGTCLNKRADPTKTMLLVVLLGAIANLLNTVILASLFGYNIAQEVEEMQVMMNTVLDQVTANSGAVMPADFLTVDYITKMFIISMAFMGMLQGYITYVVSLMILKRLRFPVQKPKSLFLYYPPKWTGILALVLTFVYTSVTTRPLQNEILQSVAQCSGICATVYLMCFGVIGLIFLFRIVLRMNGIVSAVFSILLLFMMTPFIILLGMLYIITDYHRRFIETGKLL